MCKVTIAIPVYNVTDYVEESVASALNQTFDDYEVLIIDDKGTDNSMDKVWKMSVDHPRGFLIRIVEHPHNMGTGATKNTAMKEAKGKYLYFMDSDDTIIPETIELLYDKMIEYGADLVAASFQCVKGDEVEYSKILVSDHVEGDMALCRWMEKNKVCYEIATWNKLYNIDFLRKNKVYCVPHHRNEDTVFSFQIALYARNIVTLPIITYNYYWRPGSVMLQRISDFYYQQYLEIMDERTKLLKAVSVKKPSIIYGFYLEPFFNWFIQRVLYSDFSSEKKQQFYQHLRKMFTVDFGVSDLYGWRFRMIYRIMKLDNYKFLYVFYLFDDFAQKVCRKLSVSYPTFSYR